MPILDDLATVLENAGVGTRNVNIFGSSKASIPTGAGPYLSMTETGGPSPDYIHNQAAPAYEYPTVQVLTRASTYAAARTMAVAAYAALVVVKNTTINGVNYVSIRPLQSRIIDMQLDDKERPQCAFNVIADKATA